jgi:hypothetical protein
VRKLAAFAFVSAVAALVPAAAFASSPSATGGATPATVAPGSSTRLTVVVTPGTTPASTDVYVSCNLSSIGGSFIQLFADDGTSGDAHPGDLVFTYVAMVDPAAALGPRSFPCVVSDSQGRSTTAQIALMVDALPNQAPALDAGSYSAREGHTVTLTASGLDPEGGTLSYGWDLDGDGVFETPGQTAQLAVDDGPATRIVGARAEDPVGAATAASAMVTVTNVAPTATFAAPADVAPGASFTLALANPSDPSAADTAAGFTYAVDCGSGYSSWSAHATATCSAGTASQQAVGAKIRDKDGGVTEYRRTVSAALTFGRLCELTRELARRPHAAESLCKKLTRAARARSPKKRAALLSAYRNELRARTGARRHSAFAPADEALLVRLSRLLT